MAGAFITIAYDDRGAVALLDRLDRFGAHPLIDARDQIGEYLIASTQARAAQQVEPDGTPWLPLNALYARRKAKKRPSAKILVYDFHLLGDLLAYANDGEDLVFGTGAIYGAAQQWGTDNIPARPWLGLTPEDGQEIEQILADREQAAIDGAG